MSAHDARQLVTIDDERSIVYHCDIDDWFCHTIRHVREPHRRGAAADRRKVRQDVGPGGMYGDCAGRFRADRAQMMVWAMQPRAGGNAPEQSRVTLLPDSANLKLPWCPALTCELERREISTADDDRTSIELFDTAQARVEGEPALMPYRDTILLSGPVPVR